MGFVGSQYLFGGGGGGGNGLLNNLHACWEFDEASGSTVAEAQGITAYDGTVAGCTVVSGLNSNARHFNNSTSYSINMGTQVYSDMGANVGALTAAFWVKFDTIQAQILMRGDYESGTCSMIFGATAAGLIDIFVNVTGDYAFPGGYQTSTSTTTMTTGVWYHVMGIFDGTDLKLYIDNTLEATVTVYANTGYSTISMRDNLMGGYHNHFLGYGEQTGNSKLHGALDEMRIWLEALDSTKRSAIYNSGAGLAYSSFTA